MILTGKFTDEKYTLIMASETIFLAAMVGCNGDKPECCPWKAQGTKISSSKDTTITVDITVETRSSLDDLIGFPVPEDADHTLLSACPDDYYTVSDGGGCCPVCIAY